MVFKFLWFSDFFTIVVFVFIWITWIHVYSLYFLGLFEFLLATEQDYKIIVCHMRDVLLLLYAAYLVYLWSCLKNKKNVTINDI